MASPPPAAASPSFSCFWCHHCNRIVRLPSPSTLLCPLCSDGFVEEINGVSMHSSAAFFLSGDSHSGREDHVRRSLFSQAHQVLSMWRSQGRQPGPSAVEEDGRRGGHLEALEPLFDRSGGSPEARTDTGSESFEPWLGLGSHRSDPAPSFFDLLQSFFGRRRGGSGTRLGFGVGLHHSSGSQSLIDVQNFLLGPGGDLLIQQLIEGGEVGRDGSNPALKAAVEAMPSLNVSKPNVDADDVYCAICKEIFDIGGEAREMPCKHIYHASCILPWLAIHNSCPICRYKMPAEVHVENQGREGLEIAQAEGNTGTTGERGLAIVGIPGIGILVRSFLLLGNGAHNAATVIHESSNINEVIQPSSLISDASSRELEFGYGVGSVTSSALRNDEIHPSGSETVGALQHSRNVNVTSHRHCIPSCEAGDIESVPGSQPTPCRRGRNFLLWLPRLAGSRRKHLANPTNRESSGSGSGSRRPSEH